MSPFTIALICIAAILVLAPGIYFGIRFLVEKINSSSTRDARDIHAQVYDALLKLKENEGGYLYQNVFVSALYGKVVLIDLLYVGKHGIYVFQIDYHSGRIRGGDNLNTWSTDKGNDSSEMDFYNPFVQNETNLLALEETIGHRELLRNIIIFPNADITDVDSRHVYTLKNLNTMFSVLPSSNLDNDMVNRLADEIQRFVDHPARSLEQHAQIRKQEEDAVAQGVCPLCGGTLLMRVSTHTGRKFWGCSNFPNCMFRKDL